MANVRLFMEAVAGRSPSKAAFSVRGAGKTTRDYVIGSDGQSGTGHEALTSRKQLYDAIKELLGDTATYDAATDGRLKRQLPLADPDYPWLFCESIGDIGGFGRPTQTAADALGLMEADPVDYSAFYPGYRLSGVTFTPRPYSVLNDSNIRTGTLTYHDLEGDTSTKQYAEEWLRFTDVETVPAGEYLTAAAGQFVFDAPSSSIDGQPAGNGQLRMFIRKKMVKMTWYQVPYSYVEGIGSATTETYISQGLGCVNQSDFWHWEKGQLLLEGVVVNRYTAFLPRLALSGNGISFSNEKMCDITFMFGCVNQPVAITPSAAPSPPGSTQIVQKHFNAFPWAHTLEFYYAKTNTPGYTSSNGRPCFPSFPYQLLWSNPNV